MISGRETAFLFRAGVVASSETDSLQLEVCCSRIYRKLQKKLMAGNLSCNTNADNSNKMKPSIRAGQMPALNDSNKEMDMYLYGYNI